MRLHGRMQILAYTDAATCVGYVMYLIEHRDTKAQRKYICKSMKLKSLCLCASVFIKITQSARLFVLDSEEPAEEADEDVPFLGLWSLGIRVRRLSQGIFGRDERVGWCQ